MIKQKNVGNLDVFFPFKSFIDEEGRRKMEDGRWNQKKMEDRSKTQITKAEYKENPYRAKDVLWNESINRECTENCTEQRMNL